MLHIKPVLDMLKVHAHRYKSYGDYSVTTLLNPPRYVHLNKRHSADKTLNYKSMFASFIGTGVHAYVEKCLQESPESYELERTVMDKVEDRIITGTFDILSEDKQIYDIKTCKVWKLAFDPGMVEWHEQQNIYAYLLHRRGVEVKGLNIIAIYLDWIEAQTERDSSYPQEPAVLYKLDLWPFEKTEAFIRERIQLMKKYESASDSELPECTPEERFEKPMKFACMKSADAKRAARVYETFDAAAEYMRATKGFGPASHIEVRYQKRTRCERYCEVNEYCDVHQRYIAAKKNNTLTEIIPYEQI